MMKAKDIAIRAFKTFLQAFIPVLCAGLKLMNVTELNELKTLLWSLLISACAAGLSAVMNLLLNSTNEIFNLNSEEDEKP